MESLSRQVTGNAFIFPGPFCLTLYVCQKDHWPTFPAVPLPRIPLLVILSHEFQFSLPVVIFPR